MQKLDCCLSHCPQPQVVLTNICMMCIQSPHPLVHARTHLPDHTYLPDLHYTYLRQDDIMSNQYDYGRGKLYDGQPTGIRPYTLPQASNNKCLLTQDP